MPGQELQDHLLYGQKMVYDLGVENLGQCWVWHSEWRTARHPTAPLDNRLFVPEAHLGYEDARQLYHKVRGVTLDTYTLVTVWSQTEDINFYRVGFIATYPQAPWLEGFSQGPPNWAIGAEPLIRRTAWERLGTLL